MPRRRASPAIRSASSSRRPHGRTKRGRIRPEAADIRSATWLRRANGSRRQPARTLAARATTSWPMARAPSAATRPASTTASTFARARSASSPATFWVFLASSWPRSFASANSVWNGAKAGTASKPLKKLLLVTVSILFWAAAEVLRAALGFCDGWSCGAQSSVHFFQRPCALRPASRRGARTLGDLGALLTTVSAVSATASATLAGASAAASPGSGFRLPLINSSEFVAVHNMHCGAQFQEPILCAAASVA